MRRATEKRSYKNHHPLISIHALLAESDTLTKSVGDSESNFYPRSPCGERRAARNLIRKKTYFYPRSPCGERHPIPRQDCLQNQFLSTLSLRRATCTGALILYVPTDFYPRSPCGERHCWQSTYAKLPRISIHALLAESDSASGTLSDTSDVISIHALLAESDVYGILPVSVAMISIHALLAESDPSGH